MRIAFILGRAQGAGGISRVLSILSNGLVNSGNYKIHIVSYHPMDLTGYHWNEEIIFHDLLKKRLNMRKGILKAIPRLRHIINKNQLEVLVICGFNVGPLSVISSFATKVKLVYWSHSSFYGYKIPFKKFNEQFNCAFTDRVVTLTKADRLNYLNKTFAKKVHHIYNPIDPKLLENACKYDPNSKRIISVGRLSAEKNFHSHLIEVAKIVLNKNQDYTWHIYGSGEYEEEIRSRIVVNNLKSRVILEGHCDNIYSVYPNYSILVMTSEFEGFPMSLLEGAVNSLPLISFDVPTGPNEIIDNENGFLVSPFDTMKMAKYLNELIRSEELRCKFSIANEAIIKEFRLNSIIPKWDQMLKELVD